ncbi:conserved hypothetical protein [Culex quinquefasciatus]|uniref:Uncharacterized protein n=1 Tax=Culex quinquefasciatus TaxID=7176 RepID=B0XBP4_CULQU|nr:conserved hypothetical protein [Culex quinquefasciatus]|eukprot:XP_001867066.1 conserved hypothetical protein [Culex quinquefasciatus]
MEEEAEEEELAIIGRLNWAISDIFASAQAPSIHVLAIWSFWPNPVNPDFRFRLEISLENFATANLNAALPTPSHIVPSHNEEIIFRHKSATVTLQCGATHVIGQLFDLQLAAELGKTLLERNKELESALKHHQNIIEDQAQEIEVSTSALVVKFNLPVVTSADFAKICGRCCCRQVYTVYPIVSIRVESLQPTDDRIAIEILVYLTKQNGALREVNDSRMKIYEQLEVSIQDLERDKYKLALENQAEKKHVKTSTEYTFGLDLHRLRPNLEGTFIYRYLCRNIETLEAKVDELTKAMDDVRRQLDAERKKNERLQSDSLSGNGAGSRVQLRPVAGCGGDGDDASLSGPDEDEITEIDTSKPENFSFAFRDQSHSTDVTDGSHLGQSFSHQHGGHHTNHQLSDLNLAEENEELIRIMQELERTRKCFVAEQNRVAELEEQLAAIAQENQILQSKIVQINTTEEMKSVHEELSILEEVRQGQMCTRCLRGFEDRPDDESIITGTDADDDRSLMDLIQNAASEAGVPSAVYRSSVTIKVISSIFGFLLAKLPTVGDYLDELSVFAL